MTVKNGMALQLLPYKKSLTSWKNSMKYQAVIFDLYGTLVDIFDPAGYYSVLREMISILGAPYNEFVKLWQSTAEKRATGAFRTLEENLVYICRELNVPVKSSQIALARWTRFDYIALSLAPKPGALETLAQLKTNHYKVGLISNCSGEPPVIWPDTPFAPFFDAAIFSSTSGLQKPDLRIYLLATDKLAVKPEDCLYIGDGDGNELTGAAGVGMHPVLIRNPVEESDGALHTGAYQGDTWDGQVINSLKEILDLL
jgi:putative hydrolase of the HAD superfamily